MNMMISMSIASEIVQYYNNSNFDIYVFNGETYSGVFSYEFIPVNSYLGDIEGEHKCVWELEVSDNVIWVQGDLAIDCAKRPRCITSMIREGFYDGNVHNCMMTISNDEDENIRVGLRTTHDIFAGEELIFSRDFY